MRNLLLVCLLLALAFGTALLRMRELEYMASVRVPPPCREDATLLRWGEFDGGYWEYYECGPSVDDYAK